MDEMKYRFDLNQYVNIFHLLWIAGEVKNIQ